jgi:hypothetical protein
MYASFHALGHELARAHQANHLAAARTRHAGRRIAMAHRAARREIHPASNRVPGRSSRLIGRPAV